MATSVHFPPLLIKLFCCLNLIVFTIEANQQLSTVNRRSSRQIFLNSQPTSGSAFNDYIRNPFINNHPVALFPAPIGAYGGPSLAESRTFCNILCPGTAAAASEDIIFTADKSCTSTKIFTDDSTGYSKCAKGSSATKGTIKLTLTTQFTNAMISLVSNPSNRKITLKCSELLGASAGGITKTQSGTILAKDTPVVEFGFLQLVVSVALGGEPDPGAGKPGNDLITPKKLTCDWNMTAQ